ncbi:hypothetical protein AB0H63_08785 [Micromonospora echinospora]|uniref:hypothetical protein n=1 Tax=Micromonospora echinospora TaxID=1877 RepID=UPI0033D88F3A
MTTSTKASGLASESRFGRSDRSTGGVIAGRTARNAASSRRASPAASVTSLGCTPTRTTGRGATIGALAPSRTPARGAATRRTAKRSPRSSASWTRAGSQITCHAPSPVRASRIGRS